MLCLGSWALLPVACPCNNTWTPTSRVQTQGTVGSWLCDTTQSIWQVCLPQDICPPYHPHLPIVKFSLLALFFLPKSCLKMDPIKTNALLVRHYILTQQWSLIQWPSIYWTDQIMCFLAELKVLRKCDTRPDFLVRRGGRRSQETPQICSAELGHRPGRGQSEIRRQLWKGPLEGAKYLSELGFVGRRALFLSAR